MPTALTPHTQYPALSHEISQTVVAEAGRWCRSSQGFTSVTPSRDVSTAATLRATVVAAVAASTVILAVRLVAATVPSIVTVHCSRVRPLPLSCDSLDRSRTALITVARSTAYRSSKSDFRRRPRKRARKGSGWWQSRKSMLCHGLHALNLIPFLGHSSGISPLFWSDRVELVKG